MDWINIFKKVLEFLRTPPLMKLDHRLNLQGRLANSNLIQIAALALVTILSISVRIPGLGGRRFIFYLDTGFGNFARLDWYSFSLSHFF